MMQPKVRRALWAAGAGIAVGAGVRAALGAARWFSFADKTVLVTGGSRGLGLAIARQLVTAGARVAICARSRDELDAAKFELRKLAKSGGSGQALAIACDVTDRRQVQQMIVQVHDAWGPIEILVNVAGVIEVGPLAAMTIKDFHRAMDVNCWGALHTILAVLPDMRRRGWGRIVNVASLGGKVPVPHLLPYSASKFALVGLSTGLRTELAQEGILVTTACPGLMRTGSPRNATFKGQNRKEYAWFSIGDALPGASMSAERAARQILHACQRGDSEIVLSALGKAGALLYKLAPNLTAELAGLVNRVLPAMGGIGKRPARGYESESGWSPSKLTALGDQAAVANNEMSG
ncbi:MAG TPA: SDR family oxidoreductase [Pirellulales bacterium]|jgi:NAD(P)-dependent dehydrogenase (short-subunit alcohol dehydrogenase family)|nr:SDR family oxidoreductase [Pirellulales bacterium]